MDRFEEYSVGRLARASGVTVRTLHHYDALGLLRPRHVALNGTRTYGWEERLRLQEILFYREMGMPLGEIAAVLDSGDPASRLRAHRAVLAEQAARAAAMLETLDRTLETLETKETTMTTEDLYRPFPAETQADYEAWLIDTYGPEMAADIAKARETLDAGGPDAMEGAMAELAELEAALVRAMEEGSDAAPLFARHRDWVAAMWGKPCPPEAYAGLADLYASHPDFVARYERLAPGFSAWLTREMKRWASA